MVSVHNRAPSDHPPDDGAVGSEDQSIDRRHRARRNDNDGMLAPRDRQLLPGTSAYANHAMIRPLREKNTELIFSY